MSSALAAANIVLLLGLAQLTRWLFRRRPRVPFSAWIGTSQAWGGWAIFAAAGVYMLTLIAVQGLR